MKSEHTRMKSSPSASDEIKPAILSPALARFHRVCIPLAVYCVIQRVLPLNSKFHPRSGFIPTQADLIKKDCNFVSKLQSFFVGEAGYSLRRRFFASLLESRAFRRFTLKCEPAHLKASACFGSQAILGIKKDQSQGLVFFYGGGSWVLPLAILFEAIAWCNTDCKSVVLARQDTTTWYAAQR